MARPLICDEQGRVTPQKDAIRSEVAESRSRIETRRDRQRRREREQFGSLRQRRYDNESDRRPGQCSNGAPYALGERAADRWLRQDIDRQRRPLRIAQFEPVGERKRQDRRGRGSQGEGDVPPAKVNRQKTATLRDLRYTHPAPASDDGFTQT